MKIGSMIAIHDPKDPRIGVFLNQRDAWLRAAHNPDVTGSDENVSVDPIDAGYFMAEGVLVVEQLLKSKFPVESVLVSDQRVESIEHVLSQVPVDVPIYCVTREVMDEIVGFPMHRGILACGRRLPSPDPLELARACRALVVLEDLSNHDNVGSVFRSVAAMGGAGVGVWITDRCCDPLYRKSLRVSMGHVLKVPYASVGDLPKSLATLHEMGFESIALTPDNQAMTVDESLKQGIERPVLLFGAEGPGLSEAVFDAVNHRVRIEMTNEVDSLNIAVAAAVSIHRYINPR